MLFLLICLLGFAGGIHIQAASPTNVAASARKVSGGKWVKSGARKKYRYANGTYAKNVWLKISGKIYYFGANGICRTGWIEYKNQKYYAASNGKVYIKKWLTEDGDRYYFQSSGICARYKWLKVGKKEYFFLKSGKMAQNKMFAYQGKYYYVDKNGQKAAKRWIMKGGKFYYFDASGRRVQKKWAKRGGEYYYLGSNGAVVKNQWVGNYYVGADGKRLKNCVKDGYYLNASGRKVIKVFQGDYIFVGDSRVAGMEISVPSSKVRFIAEVGMGYDWLKSTGGVQLQYNLKANPNVKVILALGINDMDNISSYISYYKSLIKKYPKTEFYVLSVNPVETRADLTFGSYNLACDMPAQILAFNQKLHQAFSAIYINSYEYMMENGFETFDGTHYTVSVYKDLYNYIIQTIQ